MSAHATLSASSSDRWLNCTRAPRYESQFAEPESSSYAQEGQFAHAVAEQAIAQHLGLACEPLPEDLLHFDSPDLRSHVNTYVNFALDLIQTAREQDGNAIVLLEERVDYSRWVPQGFGTCDLLIVASGVIYGVDLKFGKGLKVEAKNNSQLRLYALGASEMFSHLEDITDVVMTVVQPRLGHVAEEVLKMSELHQWADEVVAPAAALAWAGEGDFVPGDHCRWCRGKAICAARAAQNLELARLEFATPETLDDESFTHILAKAPQLAAWAKDVESYALQKALEGRKFTGYKLVAGRGSRRFTDPQLVVQALTESGVEASVIYAPQEINTLTALETAVGKKKFAQILDGLIVKSPGKPTLVPLEDKRPEFTPAARAAADFEIQSMKDDNDV